MLIVCQNCGTSYQIDPATLGPAGRSVRCARCQHVWFTANSGALSEIAKAHRAEVTAFAGMTSVGDVPGPPAPPGPRLGHLDPIPDVAPVAAAAAGSTATDDVPMWGPDPAEAAIEAPSEAGTDFSSQPPEPIAVIDAPPLAPMAPPVAEDIESVAARRARRKAGRRRWRVPVPGVSTAILVLIAIDLGLIAWRNEVVRLIPQTSSLYAALRLPVNLRGLVFSGITTETESHEGVQVLVIEGTIANTAGRVVEVPRLRFSVRNASGNEIYTWTALPTKSVLAPGEALPFRSRLASPPRETHDAVVRFFNRRDLLAGIQ